MSACGASPPALFVCFSSFRFRTFPSPPLPLHTLTQPPLLRLLAFFLALYIRLPLLPQTSSSSSSLSFIYLPCRSTLTPHIFARSSDVSASLCWRVVVVVCHHRCCGCCCAALRHHCVLCCFIYFRCFSCITFSLFLPQSSSSTGRFIDATPGPRSRGFASSSLSHSLTSRIFLALSRVGRCSPCVRARPISRSECHPRTCLVELDRPLFCSVWRFSR